jgi:hypothetical protein
MKPIGLRRAAVRRSGERPVPEKRRNLCRTGGRYIVAQMGTRGSSVASRRTVMLSLFTSPTPLGGNRNRFSRVLRGQGTPLVNLRGPGDQAPRAVSASAKSASRTVSVAAAAQAPGSCPGERHSAATAAGCSRADDCCDLHDDPPPAGPPRLVFLFVDGPAPRYPSFCRWSKSTV